MLRSRSKHWWTRNFCFFSINFINLQQAVKILWIKILLWNNFCYIVWNLFYITNILYNAGPYQTAHPSAKYLQMWRKSISEKLEKDRFSIYRLTICHNLRQKILYSCTYHNTELKNVHLNIIYSSVCTQDTYNVNLLVSLLEI